MDVAHIYKSEAGKRFVEAFYRKALRRWPVANRQVIVPTCQGDTFVIVSGESNTTPVVLFHGSGTNSSAWMRDVAEWARHYRVYAVDIIGEPGFSAPSRPPLDSGAYAAWLDEVWDHLGLAKASIVGLSLGGWLALDYAVRRPARVASLSLVSPSGIGGQNVAFLLNVALLSMFGKWGRRTSFRLVAGKVRLPPALVDALTSVFRHFRPRLGKLPIRTDAELAALSMPVQVIVGSDDALLRSGETRDRVERLVPHAQILYLEGEGHILPPQTAAIATFLSGLSAKEHQRDAKDIEAEPPFPAAPLHSAVG